MCVTNYAIYFEPEDSRFCHDNLIREDYFEVPLFFITKIERTIDRVNTIIEISTKDSRHIRIGVKAQV